VEIIDVGESSATEVIHLHEDRQFTGELDLFNDREILVTGRTGRDSRIIRVPRNAFRRMIETETDIGEIIMRAFILRRVGLMRHAQAGVVLIGSSHSGDTLRIQRFLSRNGYPHRMLDTDVDPDAGGFLECSKIGAEHLPVVVLPGHSFLKNPPRRVADALGSPKASIGDRLRSDRGGRDRPGSRGGLRRFGRASTRSSSSRWPPAGRRAQLQDRNYLGFPTGIRQGCGARAGAGAEVRSAVAISAGRSDRLRASPIASSGGRQRSHPRS
jgi:thioredoxin reductase (NADPH)